MIAEPVPSQEAILFLEPFLCVTCSELPSLFLNSQRAESSLSSTWCDAWHCGVSGTEWVDEQGGFPVKLLESSAAVIETVRVGAGVLLQEQAFHVGVGSCPTCSAPHPLPCL